MAGEWPEVKLSEVAEITSGKRPLVVAKNALLGCSIPVIGGGGPSGFTDEALFDGGVLITGRVGTLGKLFAPNGPCWPSDNALVIRRRSAATDSTFLKYALQLVIAEAAGMNRGAANPLITQGDLGRLVIHHPLVSEQRAIARILGTLDDKIELNRRMNETLEAMARALFKSWFVDFDPVRAKAEGRDLGLPESIAALFPDAFEDSELGEIPRGWATSSVYDIATYINGAAYRDFEPNQERKGLPIIKIAELKAGVTAQTGFSSVEMPEKYRINTRDILFSWSGNPDTSIDTFVWSHGPAWLNQHIFRVVPPSEDARAFVLMTLQYLRPVFAETARNKQTTGLGHVTSADLKRLLVTRPLHPVLLRWKSLVEPLLERSFGLQLESNTLAALRDMLLPKLISGELRVKEAECAVEAASA